MKKSVKVILILAVLMIVVISIQLIAGANDAPIDNEFEQGFNGYTSDEGQVRTTDFISSKAIFVTEGETVWFGPCDTTQYFHLVGFDTDGNAATDKIREGDLEVTDTFSNGMVIYKYEVPSGVASLVFSAPASVAEVYTVSKSEFGCLKYIEDWTQKEIAIEDFVGKTRIYDVADGKVIYFGAVTEEEALKSLLYDADSNVIGTLSAGDLKLVEAFGSDYGIYSYTVNDSEVQYVEILFDTEYDQYYSYLQKEEAISEEEVVDTFIAAYGIPTPQDTTVATLTGKSALFVGDSITYGYTDHVNLYDCGGWAGRIGYFCDMNVVNNGVPSAAVTQVQRESMGEKYYIYNNLVSEKDNDFDYVIMHGLVNDANKSADIDEFGTELALLFDTAKEQHPEAKLGFIVNLKLKRNLDLSSYVTKAIEVCQEKGIEYLDLYNDATVKVDFYDDVHPSSVGYDSIYAKIADWMATLGNE